MPLPALGFAARTAVDVDAPAVAVTVTVLTAAVCATTRDQLITGPSNTTRTSKGKYTHCAGIREGCRGGGLGRSLAVGGDGKGEGEKGEEDSLGVHVA